MFGFGKKNKTEQTAGTVSTPSAPATAVAAIAVPEEKFMVMPEQYLPSGSFDTGAGTSAGKKIYWLIGGAVLFLLILAGALYFFLWPRTEETPASQTPSTLPPLTTPEPTATTTTETAAPRIVASQAYGSTNQLVGNLQMTIPPLVAAKYGEAMGITVLSAGDVSLPAGVETAGGVYSLYPIGVAFDEPVNFAISASALVAPESRSEYYPAWLAGTAWQEIAGQTAAGDGWSFSLDKFPAGPLSVVKRPSAATSTPAALETEKPRPSADADSDGLTDKEETLLGTAPDKTDTDGDGHADKSEIMNGYSPLAAGAKLEAANLLVSYTNPTYGYKASYPVKWLADALDQTNKQVLFISDTEEFFEILVEENPLKKPIVDWYRGQSPALAGVPLDVTVLDGQAAVWSPDGLTLYAAKDGLIYIITYNKGNLATVNWPSLYEYFYKSFKFGNNGAPSSGGAGPAGP